MAHKNGLLPDDTLARIPWATTVRDYAGGPAYTPRATATAVASLERLNAAFRREFGRDLKINSGYRPLGVQQKFYDNRGRHGWPNTAAYPGTSVHGWGLAVDFGGLEGFTSDEHAWLRKHAGRHGWWQPPQYRADGRWPEYWHWEYRQSRDRYRFRKVKITRELDKRTVQAIGRATRRPVITNRPTQAFWRKVQRKINTIMAGTKGWDPLELDGLDGRKTWEGLRLSLRKTNRLHRPGKNASRRRVLYCWQKALNARSSNRWSQRRALS